MPSHGPYEGTVAANDHTAPAAGAPDWVNVDNIKHDDLSYARIDTTASIDDVTAYAKITGFGFTIPAGSTIDGIVVTVDRRTNTASVPVDNSIKILKGGTISGTDQSTGAAWNDTSFTTVTYGSASNLWGLSWTVADINDTTGFGVVVGAKDPSVGGWIADIQVIKIQVYYTAGASGTPMMSMLGVGG